MFVKIEFNINSKLFINNIQMNFKKEVSYNRNTHKNC